VATITDIQIPETGAAPAADSSHTPVLDQPGHPLDPLSAAELEQAVPILERENHFGDNVRIVSNRLDGTGQEPGGERADPNRI
jgi:Cu2+-containing amine oxidase